MIDPYMDEHSPVLASSRNLRQFALACLVLFGGIGLWDYFGRGRQDQAITFGVLAALLGVGGLIWPRGIRPVFTTLMAITTPIGWVVSRIVLAGLFFLLFTPIAMVFKLIGRDALTRRYSPEKESYWEPKAEATDPRSYLRQS